MNKREFGSPLDVEAAFYAAFEQADPAAMRQIWDESTDIECIHPLGGRMRGEEVHTGWRTLFTKASPIAFHLSERRAFAQDGLAVHVVMESILFQDGKAEPLQVLATNVYRLGKTGWRMVSRHSSPAPFVATASSPKAVH